MENSPHLQSAIELDEKLLEFSNKLDEFGLPEDIKTQDDLNAIADGIVKHVVNPLKLWQYYVFDKQESVDALKTFLKTEIQRFLLVQFLLILIQTISSNCLNIF